MRILLVGPPGAGKGTQARQLAERLEVPHIASGDLLRGAIAEGTELGLAAKAYMDRGDLVPDELMIRFIADRVSEPDADGFVLDGFPRTDAQALALDEVLERIDRPLDKVIHLDVPNEEIVDRLSGRRMCPTCQRAYHVKYDPPQEPGRCDEDGTELVTRPDDAPETVQHRLDVYHSATKGLLRHYDRDGVFSCVDGIGTVDEVAARIHKAIGIEG